MRSRHGMGLNIEIRKHAARLALDACERDPETGACLVPESLMQTLRDLARDCDSGGMLALLAQAPEWKGDR